MKKIVASENGIAEDITFYQDSRAHLSDELRMLDIALRLEMMRQRKNRPSGQHEPYKGLVLFDDDMAAMLENKENPFARGNAHGDSDPLAMALSDELDDYESQIRERCAADLGAGRYLALPHLARIFGLSRIEERCLIICLAPELDLKYERLYAYLNDDITRKRVCVGLMLDLISGSNEDKHGLRRIFDPESPLFRFGLLRFCGFDEGTTEDSSPILSRQVVLDERIVNYLLEINRIDSRIDRIAELVHPMDIDEMESDIESDNIARRIQDFVHSCLMTPQPERRNVVIHLHGPRGAGKLEIVKTVCRRLNIPLVAGDIEKAVDLSRSFPETIWRLGREALLQQGALCLNRFGGLTELEESDKKRVALNRLYETINTFAPLTFLLGEKSWQPALPDENNIFIDIEVKVPEGGKRRQIWEKYRKAYGLDLNENETRELAGKFRFTPGRIRDVVSAARNRALWSSLSDAYISKKDIYSCCRDQSDTKLGTLAQKIVPMYIWNDIVLPLQQKTMLREICDHVKYHHIVYGEWGFDRKVSTCNGLTILFSGPSGTGKTMAAEVIANELGLELYKIDLSQIVSKYIGETEKNLNRVFTEAHMSNSILFFDEADALFGKRSEVKDAHDRYANIEIAYLLQKMEEYEGITILATNLRQNMDEAFLRRLRFSIEFPFPDEKHRELIWKNIFPSNAPLSGDIDFSFLAGGFRLTGGNIRNIALTASFYAAAESSNIRMHNIILAVQRELHKMGKLCVKGDFGKYYELIDDGRKA